ncbi:MAG: DUF2380 domain-containing protein, partial [Chlamydiia bacterium]
LYVKTGTDGADWLVYKPGMAPKIISLPTNPPPIYGDLSDGFFCLAKLGPPTKNTHRKHAIEKSNIPKHVLKENGREYPAHHHFPQELQKLFKDCGIENIHKYSDAIPLELHQKIHAKGFNDIWRSFLREEPSKEGILNKLQDWYTKNNFPEMAELSKKSN